MSDYWKMVLKRFGKAFIGGGVAALLLALAQTPSLSTLADLKVWASSLAIAFLTGGLMAIEKALQAQP